MKLELIVPATHENQGKPKKAILPPLGMAVVASLTPPDVEVSLTDENVTPQSVHSFVKDVPMKSLPICEFTLRRDYKVLMTR